LLSIAVCCRAAESTRTLDAGGNWTSNASFRTVSAVAQPHPVALAENPTHISYGGFLGAFALHTNLDHDTDGIIDENDPDDDNDGLTDGDELSGDSFNPQTSTDPFLADTDHDGASDGHEAAAGTNPHDADSQLRITAIQTQPDVAGTATVAVVTWQSRDGHTYDLELVTNILDLASNSIAVATVSASGGTGAWEVAESTATNVTDTENVFYRIRMTDK